MQCWLTILVSVLSARDSRASTVVTRSEGVEIVTRVGVFLANLVKSISWLDKSSLRPSSSARTAVKRKLSQWAVLRSTSKRAVKLPSEIAKTVVAKICTSRWLKSTVKLAPTSRLLATAAIKLQYRVTKSNTTRTNPASHKLSVRSANANTGEMRTILWRIVSSGWPRKSSSFKKTKLTVTHWFSFFYANWIKKPMTSSFTYSWMTLMRLRRRLTSSSAISKSCPKLLAAKTNRTRTWQSMAVFKRGRSISRMWSHRRKVVT